LAILYAKTGWSGVITRKIRVHFNELRMVIVRRFVQKVVKRIDEAVVNIKNPASAGKLLVLDAVNMYAPVYVDVGTDSGSIGDNR
jgi:hypothetical protein